MEHALDLACCLLLRNAAPLADRRARRLETSFDRSQATTFRLRALALLVCYLTCEADGPALRQWPDVCGRDEQAQGPALTSVLVLR